MEKAAAYLEYFSEMSLSFAFIVYDVYFLFSISRIADVILHGRCHTAT
jgi:hypothetical protein